jgi:hypothetical protein
VSLRHRTGCNLSGNVKGGATYLARDDLPTKLGAILVEAEGGTELTNALTLFQATIKLANHSAFIFGRRTSEGSHVDGKNGLIAAAKNTF